MSLFVLRRGLHTTIQDLGRRGLRGRGVPWGGAFDAYSLALANALVGNPPEAPALEMTLFGGSFRALSPLACALAGAPMQATVHSDGQDREIARPTAFSLEPGDVLECGGTRVCARTYLAVAGGFQVPSVAGSASCETPIAMGTELACRPGSTLTKRPAENALVEPIGVLRVVDSQEPSHSESAALDFLLERTFQVAPASDRMGVRLSSETSPTLSLDPNRISVPVIPGAIEFTGAEWIILGPASGTMGGYPVVAYVITADLDKLGQLRPRQSLRFERVSLDYARRVHHEAWPSQRRLLTGIRTAAGEA